MQSNNTLLLSLKDIHFSYPSSDKIVLEHASLELFQKDQVGLLGDNGTGKSTLLHIAAGLLRPYCGEVRYKGVLCKAEKDFFAARHVLGYLLQHSEDQLFCPTVLEDVAFGLVNRGINEADASDRAYAMLRQLEIEHLAGKTGSKLSGGEKKIAALATILVMEPEFLFLDEPTNNLSAGARSRFIAFLEESNLPFITISHDEVFLQKVCSKFYTLENGCCTEVS